MDTTFKSKVKRSKSQVNERSLFQSKLKQQKVPKGLHHHRLNQEGRRCHCCNQKQRYPDYLAQLRKQRIQKIQRKALAQQLMRTPIPLIQSRHMLEQIKQFSPEQHNFISKMSNKVSEYEQTPPKSILHSFHQSIIKSHSKKQVTSQKSRQRSKKLAKQDDQHQEQFKFQIKVQNHQINEIFSRKFTAVEYGAFGISVIEQILSKAI